MENINREELKDLGYSEDILPTKEEERKWSIGNFATVWMGAVHNIPNYIAIGGLFALGLSVGQVFGAIIVASIVLSVMMVLNGHAGSKYGLPFSMLVRLSYGTKGAIIPGVLRGVIAGIMWFGFQTYAGSQALSILISKLWPTYLTLGGDWNLLGLSLPGLISFLIFWLFNVALIYGGMEVLGKFTNILSPLVYIVFGGMAIWAINLAGGIGPILAYTGTGVEGNKVIIFVAAVTAVLAAWAAPMVNVSDFTRLARSTKDQAIGQTLGLVVTYLLFAVASISIIVGSEIAFGTPIWNVLDVVARFDGMFAIGISVLTLCLTTLSVNVTGNIVPAGYQLASLFPKKLTFKTGALVAAVIGILVMPWKLMENATSIFLFLNIVAGLLAPVAGVMLAQYFVISKTNINLKELYSGEGKFPRTKNGFNVNAIVTTVVAGVICLIGNFVPFFKPLYDISWFAGFISAFVLYCILEMYSQKRG
ncbi:NCS1 family nucleobase:cation symporter [Sporosarcina thermotolerans]|uniref:NCS1 family nucleobase:cation symporter n=1 Tax=Sporosarcina thermotolerans TaxID=633404 RepID=A0AAW9AFQ4_9BACL|nr:NCS1 family nucleobase:cation symporter [Sporosarcina thermotolerans]MDW0117881.1 NCS1 family nucleobase:cation symporter [Sporosarcina thermotolerans]WHT49316.1 NCS1 family nucleobase:cation symporter [Sporosarcina thermotolerans]